MGRPRAGAVGAEAEGGAGPPEPPEPPERRASLDHPGDDSAPGYSHKRPAYRVPEGRPGSPDEPYVPYAELHCHSDFSFLDGASDPESLIEEAARLRLAGLALTDHDGFYAAARFAEAAKAYDLPTVYGAELSLGLTVPQNGVPDPEGEHLLVLARGVEGYHRLSAAITEAQLRGDEKGRPLYDLDELGQRAEGHWLVLTGCRKGPLRSALTRHAEAGGRPGWARPRPPGRWTTWSGCSAASTSWSRSSTPACRPTRRPTTCWPRSPPSSACRSSPPATCTSRPPRNVAWPPRWPRSGPGAAWPRWTAGCHRPGPTCAPATR